MQRGILQLFIPASASSSTRVKATTYWPATWTLGSADEKPGKRSRRFGLQAHAVDDRRVQSRELSDGLASAIRRGGCARCVISHGHRRADGKNDLQR